MGKAPLTTETLTEVVRGSEVWAVAKYRLKLLDVEIETTSSSSSSAGVWRRFFLGFAASLLAGLVLFLLL